jgi:hypothetical protein
VRSGAVWNEQDKLVAGDPAQGDRFGDSVAVDGDTAVIGAPRDSHGPGFSWGSAYVFTRSGGNWSQQQKLIPSDIAAEDLFGHSVAVDGDIAVIGSPRDDQTGFDDAGSAYVFTRSGATWTEHQKLVASDPEFEAHFGSSVAIDGDLIVIGASRAHLLSGGAERVYVFSQSAGVWSEQERLSSTQADDGFGVSVAVEGNRFLAGAPYHSVLGSGPGATFVFEYEPALPSLPFSDGFESGDLSAWSRAVP